MQVNSLHNTRVIKSFCIDFSSFPLRLLPRGSSAQIPNNWLSHSHSHNSTRNFQTFQRALDPNFRKPVKLNFTYNLKPFKKGISHCCSNFQTFQNYFSTTVLFALEFCQSSQNRFICSFNQVNHIFASFAPKLTTTVLIRFIKHILFHWFFCTFNTFSSIYTHIILSLAHLHYFICFIVSQ